jgi:putative effector of murein hydrolase
MSLLAYYMLKKHKPDARRPFSLPGIFKYIALLIALILFIIWSYGGYKFSQIGGTETYFWLGWATLLAYIPFYLYRTRVQDHVHHPEEPGPQDPGRVMEK